MIARMQELPHRLYRADQVRELDRIAIEEFGMAGIDLMERAGAAAFEALRDRFPSARSIAVLCGAGNNGGDGYVVARLARESGMSVKLYALHSPGGLAAEMAARLRASDVLIEDYAGQPLVGFDVVVDAIFGTGLDRAPEGVYRSAVDAINASGAGVVAVDLPTGLHADSGRVMGAAVRADVTVTFIGLKQGMLTGAGRLYCGTIRYSSLGVPEEIFERVEPAAARLSLGGMSSLLAPRRADAHKGDFGRVLIIGGDLGMMGAAILAGEAALRTGAGLVTIATRGTHAPAIAAARPELMSHGVEEGRELRALLDRATVVAIGPGLGRSAWGARLLGIVLDADLPLVVDADALNLLAISPERRDDWVITPHPGEAARLLRCTVAEIERDRFQAVRDLQSRFGGVAVLKGAGSLVCAPSEPPLPRAVSAPRFSQDVIGVCDAGNPGMASGGMGDALTGIIAALIAQGMPLANAACLGVALHAEAGDRAAEEGERGLIASDLIARLRGLVNPSRRRRDAAAVRGKGSS
jgi:hydroxyethylthiazole kinase-like uncharacterized protein yjeF